MGLIKCPDCGKEISTRVTSCPNCGCPIDVIMSEGVPVSKEINQISHQEADHSSSKENIDTECIESKKEKRSTKEVSSIFREWVKPISKKIYDISGIILLILGGVYLISSLLPFVTIVLLSNDPIPFIELGGSYVLILIVILMFVAARRKYITALVIALINIGVLIHYTDLLEATIILIKNIGFYIIWIDTILLLIMGILSASSIFLKQKVKIKKILNDIKSDLLISLVVIILFILFAVFYQDIKQLISNSKNKVETEENIISSEEVQESDFVDENQEVVETETNTDSVDNEGLNTNEKEIMISVDDFIGSWNAYALDYAGVYIEKRDDTHVIVNFEFETPVYEARMSLSGIYDGDRNIDCLGTYTEMHGDYFNGDNSYGDIYTTSGSLSCSITLLENGNIDVNSTSSVGQGALNCEYMYTSQKDDDWFGWIDLRDKKGNYSYTDEYGITTYHFSLESEDNLFFLYYLLESYEGQPHNGTVGYINGGNYSYYGSDGIRFSFMEENPDVVYVSDNYGNAAYYYRIYN